MRLVGRRHRKRRQSAPLAELVETVLHSAGKKNPGADVLFHIEKSRLRLAILGDAHPSGELHTREYGAVCFLTFGQWLPGFSKVNQRLMEGASAGHILREEKFACFQNRLVVVFLPWFLVPKEIRQEVSGRSFWWEVEVYPLCAVKHDDKQRNLGTYGFMTEFHPRPRTSQRPSRKWMGLPLIWRLAKAHDRYTDYLTTDTQVEGIDIPIKHVAVVSGSIAGVGIIIGAQLAAAWLRINKKTKQSS